MATEGEAGVTAIDCNVAVVDVNDVTFPLQPVMMETTQISDDNKTINSALDLMAHSSVNVVASELSSVARQVLGRSSTLA